jgi:hypothetical protein
MSLLFWRKRQWDPQPTTPCQILLAGDGRSAFSAQAVNEALARATAGSVGVVTVARIHGTSLGLPNPGLLPTRHELAERHGWVAAAVDTIVARGGAADGQVVVTRRVVRALARIARTRAARIIVIDETPYRGLRRLIEGDTGRELARRLRRDGIEVVVVPVSLSIPT